MIETMDVKAMPTVQIIQALGKRFREYRIAARMTQKRGSRAVRDKYAHHQKV